MRLCASLALVAGLVLIGEPLHGDEGPARGRQVAMHEPQPDRPKLDLNEIEDRIRAQSARQEWQRLQGTWECTALEQDGKKVAAADHKDRTIFFGGEAVLVRQGEKVLQVAAQKLDPARSPKTINVIVMQGPQKGEVQLGIYELQGDTLTLCLDAEGQKRPADFKASGPGVSLAVYKRRLAAADGEPAITGKYRTESALLDGRKHTGEAVIERRGDAYLVTYLTGKAVAYVGVGVRTGATLSVCWASRGQGGISVYQIEPGPKLVGQYTELGGIGLVSREVLTSQEKSD
jgi:uncharacterized protein (TIGR03067 family)